MAAKKSSVNARLKVVSISSTKITIGSPTSASTTSSKKRVSRNVSPVSASCFHQARALVASSSCSATTSSTSPYQVSASVWVPIWVRSTITARKPSASSCSAVRIIRLDLPS